jgi:leader peptidase (prepilin peptidase) / N-methyltransferase
MGLFNAMLDPRYWAAVPFHFWSLVFLGFGCIVGSFLNVCIHRMPIGQSVVSPPSHCPHCQYSIPWYLNIPLITWLYLRGKCANCGAPIAIRYFLVELLTGLVFLSCWLTFGHYSALVVLVYCFFIAGLIVATFIDLEHLIIPDEITIGGMVVGFICSFLVPALHDESSLAESMRQSLLGMGLGAGTVYAIVRAGKLVFGRQKVSLEGETKIVFTEAALLLPDKEVPYEELFYRESDSIRFQARTLEIIDRCYMNVAVKLSPKALLLGDEKLDPESVIHLEATTNELVLPREAMGFGDVKFMGAIGAFLGWQAVVFCIVVSSLIGALVGVSMVLLGKRELSSRLPFGPYIALAAVLWIFAGTEIIQWYMRVVAGVLGH